jgi:NAD(P)H-dependent FMN reductase
LVAFRGKTAALLSASPGAFGGMRSLITVRAILGHIGVLLLPSQVTVPKAHEAFDDAGKLKDERKAKQVGQLAKDLVELIGKLKG